LYNSGKTSDVTIALNLVQKLFFISLVPAPVKVHVDRSRRISSLLLIQHSLQTKDRQQGISLINQKLMIASQSRLRIIIPAYGTNHTLAECIQAVLEATTYSVNCEIFLIDNGSKCDIKNLAKQYPVTILERKNIASAAYARNEGARGFTRGTLVFIDSDVVCETSCIRQLVAPIESGSCDAAMGNYSTNTDGLTFAQKYKQLYVHDVYNRKNNVLTNYFWTAISAVDAEVFNNVGGFDTNFRGATGEDQEFGIRLTKQNYRVHVVPAARGQHRHVYTIAGIISNDFKKGISAITNSLGNRVPICHNRHADKASIAAVFLSVFSVAITLLAFFLPHLLYITIASLVAWLLCRKRLCACFLKNASVMFCLRSIVLMFVLDLVRCSCVIVGLLKNELTKPVEKAGMQLQNI
jgi:cellulose synthase/poly-beta-1,6-N-acetylglucosamine synthase-like glycosyltransferase